MTKRLLILSLPLLVLLAPLPTRGQATGGRAGLVVQFGDGSVRTSCVAFEGESISSFELLQRSGLDVIAQTSGNNAAVCKIGSDGCDFPAEPCFCKSGSGQQSLYWAFWRLVAEGWQYSNQGAGVRRISDGEVDGWGWGNGNVQSGVQPPVIPFEQICPTFQPPPEPPASTPTPQIVVAAPTATPMSTTTPSATITATTQTPQPTSTPSFASTTTVVDSGRSATPVASYVVFGVMLLGLSAAIGAVAWRQRR